MKKDQNENFDILFINLQKKKYKDTNISKDKY